MKKFVAISILIVSALNASSQSPSELLSPVGIQKAAQEITLYVRAGEICGFRNHQNVRIYYDFLRRVDKNATEMGIASAHYMVDGMIAQHGKARVCAEAKPSRVARERLLDQLN